MLIQIAEKIVWLNYHHLYYFKVISTEGSISKAAEKLRLGQPTLSTQLRDFESSLGVLLFDRRHKKLILNETGKIVQAYANEIFRMGSEMVEVVHDKLPEKRTHLQIGALDSVPKKLLLEISKAALNHSNCTISILEGKADELLRELVNHSIDLIISNFVPSLLNHSGLSSKSISRAPVSIYGAEVHRHLKKGFPKSLQQQPFILPTSHSKLRNDIEHYFRLAGIQIDIVAETQDTALQKLMGIDAIGLIPMTSSSVIESVKRKELFEIGKLEGVHEELFLIAASRKIANPVSSALMKTFKLKQ